jgi:hypothetical protein
MDFSDDFEHLLASPDASAFAGSDLMNIDALVARQIQEAVAAANIDDKSESIDWTTPRLFALTFVGFLMVHAGSTFMTEEPSSSSHPVKPRTFQPTNSASARPPSAGPSHGLGSSALDVPGHAEATIRLHKARIKGLEDECSKLTQALTERDKQLAEAKKENKALKTEQGTWAKTQKTLELQVEKLKRAAADAESGLLQRELALKELSKEGGKAEKEKRAGEAESRARDIRLQRALEEVEKYKAMLADVKAGDRSGKDVQRGEADRLLVENKKLERQRAELIVAFKKQLKLIDVLKRQKLHLEASRALQFTEQEFLSVLELGSA